MTHINSNQDNDNDPPKLVIENLVTKKTEAVDFCGSDEYDIRRAENVPKLMIEKGEPIVKVVGKIFAFVFENKARWLSVVPDINDVEVKCLIGDRNLIVAIISSEIYKNILSRLKIIANLKLSIKGEPQGGSFKVNHPESDETAHAHIAIIPLPQRESVFIDFEFKPIDHSKPRPFVKDDLR